MLLLPEGFDRELTLEEIDDLALQYADNFTIEELAAMGGTSRGALTRKELVLIAQKNDNVEGFEAYFNVVFGLPLVDHARHWIDNCYISYSRGGGLVIYAHRDSAKTTVLTHAWASWRIGKEPLKSSILLQVGDAIASRNTKVVARIIEVNPGFREIFTEIVPDEKAGWGVDTGFYVTDDGDPDFATKRTATKDPSYIGAGIGSAAIGMRPTGQFLVDDIHDYQNTSSPRKFETVMNKLTSEYMPMLTLDPSQPKESQKTWKIFIGTPWVEGDALDFASGLRNYATIATALYVEIPGPPVAAEDYEICDIDERNAWFVADEEGEDSLIEDREIKKGWWKRVKYPAGYSEDFLKHADVLDRPMYYPRFSKWIIVNWPEKFSLKYIEEKWAEAGGDIEFYRMYLLDLAMSEKRIFTWQEFDKDLVIPTWNMYLGCDFANVMADVNKPEKYRSNYALAYIADAPGGPVITGGRVGKFTADQGEGLIVDAIRVFPNYRTCVIEGDGKGELFYHYFLKRNPGAVRVRMETTGGRGKRERLGNELQPWFANGIVRISDADDQFLNQLRKEMRNYPFGKSDDCLDAVYWALFAMRHLLTMRKFESKEQLKKRIPDPNDLYAEPEGNPMRSIGVKQQGRIQRGRKRGSGLF